MTIYRKGRGAVADETFISYSRKDSDFVIQLINALNARSINAWWDKEDIAPATQWKKEVLLGVQCCNNFVFVISPDSVASEYCQEELECALRHNKRLIPILYRAAAIASLHPALTELNWIFFNDFELGINKLIEVLETPVGQLGMLCDRKNAYLEVWNEYGWVKTVPLLRSRYFIGRNPMVDSKLGGVITISDSTAFISRIHLELTLEDGRWKVIDRSRNGFHCFPRCVSGFVKNNMKLFLGDAAYLVFKEESFKPESRDDQNPTMA